MTTQHKATADFRLVDCPSSEAFSAWFSHTTVEPETSAIAKHVRACEECSALAKSLETSNWTRPLLAAALVLIAVSSALLIFNRNSNPDNSIERAAVALEQGNHLDAYQLLAQGIAQQEAPNAWSAEVQLLAGNLNSGSPPQFRDANAWRSVFFPAGRIATDRPDVRASEEGPSLSITVVQIEGLDLIELFAGTLTSSSTTLAYPSEQPSLVPGNYELRFKPAFNAGGMHGFTVAQAPQSLTERLERIALQIENTELRKLARVHTYLDADFDGEALAELLDWQDPPAAVTDWREHLVDQLCWHP